MSLMNLELSRERLAILIEMQYCGKALLTSTGESQAFWKNIVEENPLFP